MSLQVVCRKVDFQKRFEGLEPLVAYCWGSGNVVRGTFHVFLWARSARDPRVNVK